MKVLQEITAWDTPNHIYFVNDSKDKMFAYIRASGKDIERFKVPMPLKVSGRKFKEIENTFGYTVSENAGEWACTCAGWKFRGACKHVTELQAA